MGSCLRLVVARSDSLVRGQLFVLTAHGGTIGSGKQHKHLIHVAETGVDEASASPLSCSSLHCTAEAIVA